EMVSGVLGSSYADGFPHGIEVTGTRLVGFGRCRVDVGQRPGASFVCPFQSVQLVEHVVHLAASKSSLIQEVSAVRHASSLAAHALAAQKSRALFRNGRCARSSPA